MGYVQWGAVNNSDLHLYSTLAPRSLDIKHYFWWPKYFERSYFSAGIYIYITVKNIWTTSTVVWSSQLHACCVCVTRYKHQGMLPTCIKASEEASPFCWFSCRKPINYEILCFFDPAYFPRGSSWKAPRLIFKKTYLVAILNWIIVTLMQPRQPKNVVELLQWYIYIATF